VKETVIAGSDIHARGHRCVEYRPQHHLNGETCGTCETPLTSIFSSFSDVQVHCANYLLSDPRRQKVTEQYNLPVPAVADALVPVMSWIELLYEAGIDLSEYGRKEKELHRDRQVRTHFCLRRVGRG
jgi:hypothetical protein